jgi:secreted Zn-dependent insulinase-like peptidase
MTHPLSFRKFSLKNGLTVYWQRRRGLKWDAVRAVVRAGYRYDRPEAVHVAHMLEHVMSCGTQGHEYPTNSFRSFQDWCLEQGFLIRENEAGPDAVTFDGESSSSENLPRLLTFMADFILRPTLDRGLEKERDIIKAERDEEMTADQRRHERLVEIALYGDHQLAHHTRKPEDEALDALTLSDLQDHQARLYHPKNMSLIVVSGFAFEELRPLLEKAFSVEDEFTLPPSPTPIVYPSPPGRPIRNIALRGRKTEVELRYIWRVPPKEASLLPLAKEVIRDALTERLRERLRDLYEVIAESEECLDYAVLYVILNIRKAMLRRVIAAIRSTLRSRRGLRPFVLHCLRLRRHDELTMDLDIAAAIAMISSYVEVDEPVPRSSRNASQDEETDPDEALDFLMKYFRHDQAVVSIYETDS